MNRASPNSVDVKRLYAESGNQCAFPKCINSITQGSTIIGEICHIKASSPGGPRYDSEQTSVQRHGYENLILLCANHHKVIDDDDEAYSVARLQKMKSDHSKVSTTLLDSPQVDQIVEMLIDQSVTTQNQRGGIAAHTINATTLNVHAASPNTVRSSREIQAIEKLWNVIVALQSEFSDVQFLLTILTPTELDDYFSGRKNHQVFDAIDHYQNHQTVFDKMNSAGIETAQKERPFTSVRAFAIYSAIQGLLGRSAMLFTLSFKEHKYLDWRKDSGIDQILSSVFPTEIVKLLKENQVHGYANVLGELDLAFNIEAKIQR